MKNFKVKLKLTSMYLQARFSDKAKEELLKDARKTIVRDLTEEDAMWIGFSYFDETGYYVPAEQLIGSIHASSTDFKMKAKKSSLLKYAKATLFVSTVKNYIGKKNPDELITSYVKRKDGNRVRIVHPCFKPGTTVEFELSCLDDDFSDKTIKEIIENAGKKCGIGARRPMFGRFEVVEFTRK